MEEWMESVGEARSRPFAWQRRTASHPISDSNGIAASLVNELLRKRMNAEKL